MNSTSPAKTCKPDQTELLISSRADLYQWLGACPRAQTITGWDNEAQSFVLVPANCNTWKCRTCAQRRIRRLSAMTAAAKPNRLITLTIDPAWYASPRDAFDRTRRKLPVLWGQVRKRWGPAEYLRVTELHRSGFPHYHFLVRSAYIPQPWLAAAWEELSYAQIVDVRQVKPSFCAYTYLLKYLSKMHSIQWTERHCAYSKAFFPKPATPYENPNPLTETQVVNEHPVNLLMRENPGATLQRLTGNRYRVLDTTPPQTQEEW